VRRSETSTDAAASRGPERELISLWRPLSNDEITSRVQHAKDHADEQSEDAGVKRSWRRKKRD